MISWDRCGDAVIGYFSPRQIRWLRDHVGAMRDALQTDLDREEVHRHPNITADTTLALDRLCGPPTDREIVTTTSAWCPAALIHGPERVGPEFTHRRLADATLVLDSLPRAGGVVLLPGDRGVRAWVWTLAECGIHVAWRLGLEQEIPRLNSGRDDDTSSRPQRSLSGVLVWLGRVADGLLEAARRPDAVPKEKIPTTDGW